MKEVDKIICGIDEAGRGPLAGPVTAAAFLFLSAPSKAGSVDRAQLVDSKSITHRRRERIETMLRRSNECAWGIGWVWPQEIDRLNIHHASLEAMRRAYRDLEERNPDLVKLRARVHAIVDGKFTPDIPVSTEALVGGDRTIAEVSAGSILAKTARDRWMVRYGESRPEYLFEKHKGYPSAAHREILTRIGPCAIHRRSFRGVPSRSAPDA